MLIVGCLLAGTTLTHAQTEPYYAMGEDIDNMVNGDEVSVLIQIEEKLQEFSLYRTLEGYFLNVKYISADEALEVHAIEGVR